MDHPIKRLLGLVLVVRDVCARLVQLRLWVRRYLCPHLHNHPFHRIGRRPTRVGQHLHADAAANGDVPGQERKPWLYDAHKRRRHRVIRRELHLHGDSWLPPRPCCVRLQILPKQRVLFKVEQLNLPLVQVVSVRLCRKPKLIRLGFLSFFLDPKKKQKKTSR